MSNPSVDGNIVYAMKKLVIRKMGGQRLFSSRTNPYFEKQIVAESAVKPGLTKNQLMLYIGLAGCKNFWGAVPELTGSLSWAQSHSGL